MDLSDVLSSSRPIIPEILAAEMARRSSISKFPSSIFHWLRRQDRSSRPSGNIVDNSLTQHVQASSISGGVKHIMLRFWSNFSSNGTAIERQSDHPVVGIVPPRAELELIRDFYHNKKGLPNEFCSKVRHIRFKNILNFH